MKKKKLKKKTHISYSNDQILKDIFNTMKQRYRITGSKTSFLTRTFRPTKIERTYPLVVICSNELEFVCIYFIFILIVFYLNTCVVKNGMFSLAAVFSTSTSFRPHIASTRNPWIIISLFFLNFKLCMYLVIAASVRET